MKIISSYKDYYDYLSGIYGEDPKIVLDRRKFDSLPYPPNDEGEIITFFICDKFIQSYYYNGKYYWGEDIFQFATENSVENFKAGKEAEVEIESSNKGWRRSSRMINILPMESKARVNTRENCPIIRVSGFMKQYLQYPILKDTGIAAVLPPQAIYLLLTEWLAPKEDHVDTRTNNEKITGQGFDLKTSFRNVK